MSTSLEASRHHVTRFEPGALSVPHGYGDNSHAYRRTSHIDRQIGATYTGLGTCQLEAGGAIAPHVHSYEECLYVLSGSMVLTIDGESVVLRRDDCAFVPLGSTHTAHNPGPDPCRWIDLFRARRPVSPTSHRHVLGRRGGSRLRGRAGHPRSPGPPLLSLGSRAA